MKTSRPLCSLGIFYPVTDLQLFRQQIRLRMRKLPDLIFLIVCSCVNGCRINFGQDGVVNIYKNVRYTSNRRIQKQNIEVGEVVLISEDNVKVNYEGWELWLRFTLGLKLLFER